MTEQKLKYYVEIFPEGEKREDKQFVIIAVDKDQKAWEVARVVANESDFDNLEYDENGNLFRSWSLRSNMRVHEWLCEQFGLDYESELERLDAFVADGLEL